jgi:biopolymer transport protein ExbB/TolQ
MALFREDGGATTLHRPVADQAPFLGLLATVPGLGTASISLEVIDGPH